MGSTFSSDQSQLDEAVHRAEARIGKLSIEGRYHRNPKRLEDDYVVEKKALGSGYNGSVLLASHKETGVKYAVKNFKLHGVPKEKKEELSTEAEIFLSLDHPHIARLMDVYESEEYLSLVMECMDGGELFDRVTKKKVFCEKDAADATYQMLLAVNYIHKENIVHRDLKLENFLYDKKDSDFLKLIDFGFSKVWDRNTKMDNSCGTISYVAPEVLAKSYTSSCDLWSLGVIVFILLAGYMPFSGQSEGQILRAIKTGKYTWRRDRWDRISDKGCDFVRRLLVLQPDQRLSAEEALLHPFIADRHKAAPEVVDRGIADALCSFAKESQIRRKCMQMMAWTLSLEDRRSVRQYFLELDESHTGVIRLNDLKKLLEDKYQMAEADSRLTVEAFAELDEDHDGEIHYSDFLAAMMSTRIALHRDLLHQTFQRFDAKKTGYITVEGLNGVLGPSVNAQEFMASVDTDGDGRISFQEFIAFLQSGKADGSEVEEAANTVIDVELQRHGEEEAQSQLADPTPFKRKRDMLKQFGTALKGKMRLTMEVPR